MKQAWTCGEEAVSACHSSLRTDRMRGKPTCMKDNHFQSGANLLKGFVLNLECCFSFQSTVIKCACILQKEQRGRLTIIKSPLDLARISPPSGLLLDTDSKASIGQNSYHHHL